MNSGTGFPAKASEETFASSFSKASLELPGSTTVVIPSLAEARHLLSILLTGLISPDRPTSPNIKVFDLTLTPLADDTVAMHTARSVAGSLTLRPPMTFIKQSFEVSPSFRSFSQTVPTFWIRLRSQTRSRFWRALRSGYPIRFPFTTISRSLLIRSFRLRMIQAR